ncbi:MAG: hypothetical protein NQU46_08085 [Methanolinea sp.]|nr:hypothetical protein [Methanolinea sp.]
MLSVLLLAGSLLGTAILWLAGFPFFFLFLFIPLIPQVWQERKVRSCPVCGFSTTDGKVAFCPYDGTPLIGGKSP